MAGSLHGPKPRDPERSFLNSGYSNLLQDLKNPIEAINLDSHFELGDTQIWPCLVFGVDAGCCFPYQI
jgi:hypothetical protein